MTPVEKKLMDSLYRELRWITRSASIELPIGMTGYIIGDTRMASARLAIAEAEALGMTDTEDRNWRRQTPTAPTP